MTELSTNYHRVVKYWARIHSTEKSKILQTDEARILKAMLCGFLAGDGSVQVRKEKTFFHYQLDFYPDDELMMDVYVDAIIKVYGKSPSIRKKEKFYWVRKTSKTIVTDLLQFASFDTKGWSIPNSLLTCFESKAAWLNAFFSAEAYVGPNHIKVQTVNKVGMSQVSRLLNEFEIDHNTYEHQPKNKNHSRVYIIRISSRTARERYYRLIGFWHNKKINTLKSTLNL